MDWNWLPLTVDPGVFCGSVDGMLLAAVSEWVGGVVGEEHEQIGSFSGLGIHHEDSFAEMIQVEPSWVAQIHVVISHKTGFDVQRN